MEAGDVAAAGEAEVEEVTLREKIYALLDPSVQASSKGLAIASSVISIAVFMLIYVSIMVFCIESHPKYYAKNNVALYVVESVCVAVFSIELSAKLATTKNRRQFCKHFLNQIDFISILPYYLELFVTRIGGYELSLNSFVFLRVIRLARVFRVFKLGKYSTGLQLVIYAMRKSSEALSLLGFLLGIALVLFASLIFIAEQSEAEFSKEDELWYYNWNDSKGQRVVSNFQSIPDSFWWALVTLATVGYGDQVPMTWFGKAVGITCMIVGVLVLAFPIILISNNFSDAVKEFNQQQKQDEEAIEMGRRHSQANSTGTAMSLQINDLRESIKPSPSPHTVVSYFRYMGKTRAVYFVSSIGSGSSEIYQFRYDPVFTVSMNQQGVVETVATSESKIGQHLLQFDLVLDNEKVQKLAVESINETGVFDRKRIATANTMASPLAKISVSIPLLGERLLVPETSSPGTSVPITIIAKSGEDLEVIQNRLAICSLHCLCSKNFAGGVSTFEATVPLLASSATRSGVQAYDPCT